MRFNVIAGTTLDTSIGLLGRGVLGVCIWRSNTTKFIRFWWTKPNRFGHFTVKLVQGTR